MAICSGERGFDLQQKYVSAWDAMESGDTPRPRLTRLLEPLRVTDNGSVVGGCGGCGAATSPAVRKQPERLASVVRETSLKPLAIPQRESDRIIVTLAVGPQFQQLKAIAWPMLEAYAEKCEADLYCIETVDSEYPMLGKFHLPEFLHVGYRDILFLDCDLVITPDAPSLFDEYPEAVLAMHDDYQVLHETDWLRNEYANLLASQGMLCEPPKTCWNTGVILLRRGAERAFELPQNPFPKSHMAEQSLINLNAITSGVTITSLPREWNEQWWPNRRIEPRDGTRIYHWSNAPHEQRAAEMSAMLGVSAPPLSKVTVVEPPKPQKKKTRLENAIALAKTTLKTIERKVTTGEALLPPEAIQERFDICYHCDQYAEDSCLLCSCRINSQREVVNKLAHAGSVCPHNPPKWTAEDVKKNESK